MEDFEAQLRAFGVLVGTEFGSFRAIVSTKRVVERLDEIATSELSRIYRLWTWRSECEFLLDGMAAKSELGEFKVKVAGTNLVNVVVFVRVDMDLTGAVVFETELRGCYEDSE